ncbi:MAG: cell division protein FtsA [Chlorobiota bacterium]|jgi:cell division protein FtsA|nr:MAG: cell division protein FtsA [Chlorobiota bacterium]
MCVNTVTKIKTKDKLIKLSTPMNYWSKSNSSKKNNEERQIVVGLDIGTSKVCAIIASRGPLGPEDIEVLGIGQVPSDGLSRGVVVNIERTVRSIEKAIEIAEQQSGVTIGKVTVGIAGDHIKTFTSRGVVTISNGERVVSKADVNRLLDDAKRLALGAERKIIHVVPQDFVIDGQDGIIEPIGMAGIRLEANVNIITGMVNAIQNIDRCIERVGLEVEEIVLEPIASSRAILSEQEKEVGVALVDIGCGTTDVAVFEAGKLRYTSVIGIGGRMVTEDIRVGLGIISDQAENVKKENGCALESMIINDDKFLIPSIGGRRAEEVSKKTLCSIIQPRMEEILEFVGMELEKSGCYNKLSAGVVLTGGGAMMRGITELAESILGVPVKIGIPSLGRRALAQQAESPLYATAIGLVKTTFDKMEYKYVQIENVFEHKKHETKNGVTTEFKKVEFRKIEPEKTKIFTPEDNGEPKENIFIKMKKFFNEF